MTLAIATVLAILAVTIVLFAVDRIPLEVSALAVVALLALTGVLSPEQAFAGFANDTVILIFALLSMTQGLASTGIVQSIGHRVAPLGRFGVGAFVVALMIVVAVLSSVVSNTVTTAAFLPVAIGAAERARVARSRVLMPIAYASMLGGTIFLIGTSTNLVVSAAMARGGLAPLGFTELTPVGVPATVIGIALTALLAPFLLPARAAEDAEAIPSREYLAEVTVSRGSPFAGGKLAALTQRLALRVLAVTRGGASLEPVPELELAEGDALLLEEDRLDVLRVKDLRGLEVGSEPGPAVGGSGRPSWSRRRCRSDRASWDARCRRRSSRSTSGSSPSRSPGAPRSSGSPACSSCTACSAPARSRRCRSRPATCSSSAAPGRACARSRTAGR